MALLLLREVTILRTRSGHRTNTAKTRDPKHVTSPNGGPLRRSC